MSMRLTLRTLLAYLDDTLEPTEIKQIGQKVAESDAAQELIARIKQVTRRRRLTTPPATGPGARFDPNTVADYLDNELSTEQVAELEKTCLESDVHLAEIAACHQILTLVLGEPALVPPTAKERMYGLVRGREAIPFRKASAAAGAGGGAGEGESEADDTFLLGLPFYRKHGTLLRWALPLAGVFLLIGLGVALWLAMPRPKGPTRTASADTKKIDKPADDTKKPADDTKKPKGTTTKEPQPADTKSGKPGPGDTKGGEPGPADTKGSGTDGGTAAKPPSGKPTKEPSAERVLVGEFQRAKTREVPVLVRQLPPAPGKDEATFERLTPGSSVYGSETLVSLPGYLSELRLRGGVNAFLRGSVPQFAVEPVMLPLLESAVTLHKPGQGADAELTLHRGRLYLANRKAEGAVVVRLRFGRDQGLDRRPGARGEIWDLTLLDPETEVGMDLIKAYTRDIDYERGEEPRAELYLSVLKGQVSLRIYPYNDPQHLHAPPGDALVTWDNMGTGVQTVPVRDRRPVWDKTPPRPRDPDRAREVEKMTEALVRMSKLMVTPPLQVRVEEELNSTYPANRLLAIYTLGALDNARKLVDEDVLGKKGPGSDRERLAAIFTLRRWISHNSRQGLRLFNPKDETGILMDSKQYKPSEAKIIWELLHDFPDRERSDPATFESLAGKLAHRKVPIAELAWYHLVRLSVPQDKLLPPFNPLADTELREKAAERVKQLITEKKLPPPASKPDSVPAPKPAP